MQNFLKFLPNGTEILPSGNYILSQENTLHDFSMICQSERLIIGFNSKYLIQGFNLETFGIRKILRIDLRVDLSIAGRLPKDFEKRFVR